MSELLGRIDPKPILPVADMPTTIAFYRRIGLDVASFDPTYAWVRHRGDEVLHLRAVDGLDVAANRASAFLHVRDADAWHVVASSSGEVVGPIEDMPWGMREFALTDPSGNLVRIGHNI